MPKEEKGGDAATMAEGSPEEEGSWKRELEPLSETDPELYDFAMHLHLDPMRGISEKIKYFLEGKEFDPLSTDPESIAQEAERCSQRGEYARAMIGYVCAIDLLFLKATVSSSGKVAEGTMRGFSDKIASYSSRLREIEESASSSHEGAVTWHGLIKRYEGIGRRANEALAIVVRFYGRRMKRPMGEAEKQA